MMISAAILIGSLLIFVGIMLAGDAISNGLDKIENEIYQMRMFGGTRS